VGIFSERLPHHGTSDTISRGLGQSDGG